MPESGASEKLQEALPRIGDSAGFRHDRTGGQQSGGEVTPEPAGLSDLEDVELARACQGGDSAAFAELVQRYERLVFKIAWQKTHNRADAEDVTQDVFMHAFRSLPRLRDPQAFLGWLIAIANNRAYRFFRSRQSKLATHEEARQEQERENTRSVKEPGDPQVVELVRSLPEEYRIALTMKYLEGCSYHEIGERLSMSFHQVDYLLRKAKRALREAANRDRRKLSDSKAGGPEA